MGVGAPENSKLGEICGFSLPCEQHDAQIMVEFDMEKHTIGSLKFPQTGEKCWHRSQKSSTFGLCRCAADCATTRRCLRFLVQNMSFVPFFSPPISNFGTRDSTKRFLSAASSSFCCRKSSAAFCMISCCNARVAMS